MNDVRSIDETYNRDYLYAEYNHAVAASQMAAQWSGFEQDGDRYDLQYRTAGDDRVREEHAALHGTTLPPSDPFWEKFLPPNGWNCRCTAVQVRKGKYPASDPEQAMRLGNECTEGAKKAIFRYNPGKSLRLFPPKHPYCKAPQEARKIVEDMAKEREAQRKAEKIENLKEWVKNNLPETRVGKFKARRFIVKSPDEGADVIVNKTFYKEVIDKYKSDELYEAKLEYAKKADKLFPRAHFVRSENSADHPDAKFRVYELEDAPFIVEFKVKCNADGWFLHIMRLYKK